MLNFISVSAISWKNVSGPTVKQTKWASQNLHCLCDSITNRILLKSMASISICGPAHLCLYYICYKRSCKAVPAIMQVCNYVMPSMNPSNKSTITSISSFGV